MVALNKYLTTKLYKDVNKEHMFSYKYLKHHLGTNYVFIYELDNERGRKLTKSLRLVVSLRFLNKGHKRAYIIVYDNENGYCYVERNAKLENDRVDYLDYICKKYAELYVKSIVDIVSDRYDSRFEKNKDRNTFFQHKEQLCKRFRNILVKGNSWIISDEEVKN